MPAPKYTLDLLMIAVEEYGATLIESYDSCNVSTIIRYTCKCGESHEKRMRSVIDKGGLVCRSCCTKNMVDKVKKTTFERYGVEHTSFIPEVKAKRDATNMQRYGTTTPLCLPEMKERVKKTNLERYGVTCTVHAPEIKEKVKQTLMEKYGVEHSFQADSVKKKIEETISSRYGVKYIMQSDKFKKKVVDTNIKRRGVPYSMQSKEVREKSVATNLKKYGKRSPMQVAAIREKANATVKERYGVSHIMHCKEIKQKAIDSSKKINHEERRLKLISTNMARYGVPYSCQAPVVIEKIQANSKKYKDYVMPSGDIRKVQGYEPYALDELVKLYTEEQIKTDRKDIPYIDYDIDGKKRRYFPDIYILHENRIIEVKSTWTYSCKTDYIKEKRQACIDAGYKYETWCYDRSGKKVNLSE